MKHLVATFGDITLLDARRQLVEAHEFLVARCLDALGGIPKTGPLWGIQMKRMRVVLNSVARPAVVCKDEERFGEVVNMVATLERLVAALGWFEQQPEFSSLRVKECHPSTSSAKGSNDLILEDEWGNIVVRCEVCDVASAFAGQNGKERKDIDNLGCASGVPADGIRRFICTSPEFACAIQSAKRKWAQRQYRYREFVVGDVGATVLVELIPTAGVLEPPNGAIAAPIPQASADVLDWDVQIESPPRRPQGTIEVQLARAGRSRPIPVSEAYTGEANTD